MDVEIHRYCFRLATSQDLPLLAAWLRTPEVARWWGDPPAREALLKDGLSTPQMAMRIATPDDQPFAYTQDYPGRTCAGSRLAQLPAGVRAIDAFIGVPAMIGVGHGSNLLRLLAQRLTLAGAAGVVANLDPANTRARRAYQRAGFRLERIDQAGEHPAAALMRYRPL